jgi:pimeloyl-ACP methyl ester carboxylesterase
MTGKFLAGGDGLLERVVSAMPLYAVVDAIVAFDRFRNVDLVQQGFYRISVRLQGIQSGTSAVPLTCYPSDRTGTLGCDDMGESGAASTPGMQSFLDSRENAYVTRPFYVRYNDHSACLCELAHFRLELDCSVSVRELEDVLVRFDLQFAVRPKQETVAPDAGEVPPNPEDYSVISTHDFELRGSGWLGCHHAVPLTFEEHSISDTAVTVHTVLSDIRFKADAMSDAASPRGEPEAPSKSSAPSSTPSPSPPPPLPQPGAPAKATGGAASLADTVAVHCGVKVKPGEDAQVALVLADDFVRRIVEPLFGSFVALRAALTGFESDVEGCPVLNLADTVDVDPLQYQAPPPPAPLPRRRRLRAVAGGVSTSNVEEAAAEMWRAYVVQRSDASRSAAGGSAQEEHAPGTVQASKVAEALVDALHGIATQIFRSWHALLMLCQTVPHGLHQLLEMRRRQTHQRRWELSVLRAKPSPLEALVEPAVGPIDEEQLAQAEALRCSSVFQQSEGWNGEYAGAQLQDLCLPAGTPETQHMIFEEVYRPGQAAVSEDEISVANTLGGEDFRSGKQSGDGLLVVFCHGFQGNQYDLRYFRNRIGIGYPRARLLCCSAVEDNTHAPIAEQGTLIAEEVSRYIAGMDDPSTVRRIVFVGHSLGTLVIRAAIAMPCMEPYIDRLQSFISLGGTHLGYTFGNNNILSSAMWVYQRWTKSDSLRQLNLKDSSSDPKNGYVHALAQKNVGLGAFKHVVLVASGQDRYAPFFSARIQTAPTATEDDKIGSASIAMVRALLGPVIEQGNTTVTRLGICFGNNGTAFLDSAIGRAAHIQFLEVTMLCPALPGNSSAAFASIAFALIHSFSSSLTYYSFVSRVCLTGPPTHPQLSCGPLRQLDLIPELSCRSKC